MIPQYSLDYQVMYYDTDCGGVVHNLAYLRWVEECRSKMCAHLGIDYTEMAKRGLHAVLVRTEVDYYAPAVLSDICRVQGIVERAQGSSLWVRVEVRRAADDKLLVSVHQRLALVQMPQGRPQRVPTEWAALAAPAEAQS